MKKSASLLAVGVLTVAISIPAFAGPPYNVDDPGTAEFRHPFVYAFYTGTLLNGRFSETLPSLTLTYGLRPTVELDLGLSGSTSNIPVPVPVPLLRFRDPSFAAKWRFREDTKTGFAEAVGYQVTVNNSDTGTGTGYASHSLWYTASRQMGPGTLFGNVGANVFPRSRFYGDLFWGVVYDRTLTDRFHAGVQVYGNTSQNQQGIPVELATGIGATYALDARTNLLVQVGHSHYGNGGLLLYGGIVRDFGPPKRSLSHQPDKNDARKTQ